MFQRTELDNGLPVLTTSMPHTQSVSMAIFVGAGSRYEADEIAGVSHFLEHLLFKGTKNWPTARVISEEIEGVGGVINASTDREMTVYWCKVARPHSRRAMDVLVDMILNPLLDPVEVEKEREVVLEELRMINDYPSNRVDLLIDETMWPAQPMGRDVGGSQESVASLGGQQISDYMHRQYTAKNTVVAVAGNISHDEVVEMLSEALKDWTKQEPLDWYPVKDGQQAARVSVEQRKTDQAHLCIGLPALPLTHPTGTCWA